MKILSENEKQGLLIKTKPSKRSKHGWSKWRTPQRFIDVGCCDCGLVHTYEHKVFEIIGKDKNGNLLITPLSLKKYLVQERVKFNPELTKWVRDKKKPILVDK